MTTGSADARGVVVSTEDAWLIADLAPDDVVSVRCWALLRAGAAPAAVLDALWSSSAQPVRSFAFVRLQESSGAVTLGGGASLAVTFGGRTETVTGPEIPDLYEFTMPIRPDEMTLELAAGAGVGPALARWPGPGIAAGRSVHVASALDAMANLRQFDGPVAPQERPAPAPVPTPAAAPVSAPAAPPAPAAASVPAAPPAPPPAPVPIPAAPPTSPAPATPTAGERGDVAGPNGTAPTPAPRATNSNSTMFFADAASLFATAPAAAAESLPQEGAREGARGTTVEAVICENGHPNPITNGLCRVCGVGLGPQLPKTVPQPTLGLLRFSTAEVVRLDRGILIGRDPADLVGPDSGKHVIRVPSPRRDVSRLHVEVSLDGWQVLVTDLDSVNGTVAIAPFGQPRRLPPRQPVAIEPGTIISLADEVSFRYEATP